MDQTFRFLLSAVLLFGFLQARPVRIPTIKHLQSTVTCGDHVNFTSPTNVQKHCHGAALKTIKEELHKAKTNCTNTFRIDQALKSLGQITMSLPATNSSDCNWEREESRKPFRNFVDDLKDFVQNLNSME